jgi:hypothetical protein
MASCNFACKIASSAFGLLAMTVIAFSFFLSPAQAAIAIDASTPVRFAGQPADNVDMTSASFTPPDNSVLLVMVNADTNGGTSISVSVSDSTSRSWTTIVERNGGEAGAQSGYAGAFFAVVTTGSSMTVGVRRAANGATNRMSAKVYVITGANTASPVGNSDEGSSTTNNISPTIYTSSVNNSRGFGAADDWSALGVPTSTDTADAATYAGHISVISAYKASDTATANTAVTMNFDAFGAGAPAWNWVGVEVKPANAQSDATNPNNVLRGDSIIRGSSQIR